MAGNGLRRGAAACRMRFCPPGAAAGAPPGRRRAMHAGTRSTPSRSRWGDLWFPLLVAAAGIAVYANSLSGVFLLDDLRAIVENAHIRSLWPPGEVFKAPPQSTVSGRPLVSLSLALSFALSGTAPWGYHAVNILIHLGAGLLLYGILRRTLRLPRRRDGEAPVADRASGAPARGRDAGPADRLAAAAALLWVVHPLQTQSVTYLVQRAESLMGLFYLLTLYCFIRGYTSSRPGRWWIAAIFSCAAAMATKEVAVTAPLIVGLYDRTFLSGSWRRTWRERGAVHAGLAATWLLLAVLVAGGPRSATAGFGFGKVTALQYAMTQPGVILHYLRLAFWPHPLCLDYVWTVARGTAQVLWPGLALAGLLAAAAWALRRAPRLGFLGAWFFVILAPTSSIVPIEDLAFEHRMYLPLAAVIVLAVWGADALSARWAARGGEGGAGRRRLGRAAGAALLALVALALGAATMARNRDYRSALAMWESVARIRPHSARALCNLGMERALGGDAHGALAAYRQAVRVDPLHAGARYNLGTALREQGEMREAEEHLREALRVRPDHMEAAINLGSLLADQSRLDEAVALFRAARDGRPGGTAPRDHLAAQACTHLGNALARRGDWSEAVAAYGDALRLRPGQYRAHYNLGLALQQLGRAREAAEHYQRALALKPDHEGARGALEALKGAAARP